MPPTVKRNTERKKDKPVKPPATTPEVPPVEETPEPQAVASVSRGTTPAGPIRTPAPLGGSLGDWSSITRWDDYARAAAAAYPNLTVEHLRAVEAIESQGEPRAHQVNPTHGDTFGVTQINPDIWGVLIDDAARAVGKFKGSSRKQRIDALYDPQVALMATAAILNDIFDNNLSAGNQSWDSAQSMYFTWTPDWQKADSVNGTTGAQYRKAFRNLQVEQKAAAAPVDPPPTTTPAPKAITRQDVYDMVSGKGSGMYLSFEFGGYNSGNAFYSYGVGHGDGLTDAHEHPGEDWAVRDETPIYSLFDGTVVCVGWSGTPMWGQGCGYFADDQGGIGNITILHDAQIVRNGKKRQIKITYGHMSSAAPGIVAGARVQQGQRIGKSGTGNGWPHVHADVTINAPDMVNYNIAHNGGEYYAVDTMPAIIEALGRVALLPNAEPVEIPQPDDEPPYQRVRAKRKTRVLQRANPNGPSILPDLEPGTEFNTQHQVLGIDGKWYAVGRLLGRVLRDDLEVVKTVLE